MIQLKCLQKNHLKIGRLNREYSDMLSGTKLYKVNVCFVILALLFWHCYFGIVNFAGHISIVPTFFVFLHRMNCDHAKRTSVVPGDWVTVVNY